MSLAVNIPICHRCELRQKDCAGACACTVDGRDIIEHAESNVCPHPDGPRFAFPAIITAKPKVVSRKPRKPGPGDLVHVVLVSMGFTLMNNMLRCPNGKIVSGCGCQSMRQRMNGWGIVGCIKHRKEIIAWFTDKAGKCGVTVDGKGVAGLLRAGLKQLMTK